MNAFSLQVLPQPLVVTALRRSLAMKTLAHAYLFTGPAGLGQAEAARALTAAVLCRNPRSGEACGRCAACVKVATGNHPDLHWIEPDGTVVRLSQVRSVLQEAWFRPLEGERRCFVITAAERMTDEAANQLLKILEEPPTHALFVLIAEAATRLPATIVSRCFWLPFRPLPVEDLARQIAGEGRWSREEALVLARLAAGNPGRARELVERSLFPDLWQRLLILLTEVGSGDPLAALNAGEELSGLDTEAVLLALDMLECVLRDAWLFALGLPLRYAVDGTDPSRLSRLAARWGRFDLPACAIHIARARQRLRSHVQAQNALDALMLALQTLITDRGEPDARSTSQDGVRGGGAV